MSKPKKQKATVTRHVALTASEHMRLDQVGRECGAGRDALLRAAVSLLATQSPANLTQLHAALAPATSKQKQKQPAK